MSLTLLPLISSVVIRLVIGNIVMLLYSGANASVKTVRPSFSLALTSAKTPGRLSVSISQIWDWD
jgi:hypothetical protein